MRRQVIDGRRTGFAGGGARAGLARAAAGLISAGLNSQGGEGFNPALAQTG